jgi:hypothetical protein
MRMMRRVGSDRYGNRLVHDVVGARFLLGIGADGTFEEVAIPVYPS